MIIRTYIQCILTGLILLTGSGCRKEFLDTKIDLAQTQDLLNTNFSTLLSFANAPYVYVRNEYSLIDGNLFAAASDEAVHTSPGANVRLFNNGSWNAFNNPDNYYTGYYQGIRAANYFLENSGDYRRMLAKNRDTVSPTGKLQYRDDTLNIRWFRAEARALRAYYYFELLKRYGGVPLVTRVLSADDNTDLPRSGFDAMISFIVSEIDAVKDSMQVNWKTSAYTTNDGRLTRGAAISIKARALLWAASPLNNPSNDMAKWRSAAAAFHEVIAMAGGGSGAYVLDGNYRNYFLQNNTVTSNETIWAVRYNAGNAIERANYPITTPGGNSGITPSHDLVEAYEFKGTPNPANPYVNRDPRMALTIVTDASSWNGRTIDLLPGGRDDMNTPNATRTGYYLRKFLNDNLNLVNNATQLHHWPMIRYAETLLSYAEAMNEAFGPDNNNGFTMTARQAINAVRARAGVAMPAVVASDPTTFRAAVKRERRVELAFENHRFWDLRRWKDAQVVLNQSIRGVRVTKNAANALVYTPFVVENRVFDGSRMYLHPFPQSEINKSSGILTQNPGW